MRVKQRIWTAAACLFLALFAFPVGGSASSMQEALSGAWLIDIEKTLLVNEQWKLAYEGRSVEDKAAMRANWESKELVVDFKKWSLNDLVGGKPRQTCRIVEVHHKDGGLRMKVLPKDSVPYFVDMKPDGADAMVFVIDDKTSLALKRKDEFYR